MMHEVTIQSLGDCRQEIKVDGQNVSGCFGYNLSCRVDEIPALTLEINALPISVSVPAEVKIQNLEEIARLMDEKDFKEFCGIWNDTHA